MTGQTEGAAPLGHNDGHDGRAVAGCQRLVGSMYQGMAVAGDAGIVWCTPGLEDLLTYGTGELIGHPMTDLFPDGASYQRFRTELEWCLQSKGYLQSSVTLKGKDGVLVDADVAVASGPASMSGAAELIIAARRSQRCEERRRTEPVASLCSRSAFESRLREEVENALRGKRPLSLLFLDIDGFERRKRAGLQDGASPLKALAELLGDPADRLRAAAAYSSSEFAVLLCESDTNEAEAAANWLRASLTAQPNASAPLSPPRLAVSVGVCTFPFDETDPGCLLTTARQAMLLARLAGGDRVLPWRGSARVLEGDMNRLRALLRAADLETLVAAAAAIDARLLYKRGHSHRVSELAEILTAELRGAGKEVSIARTAGLLHDLGYVAVPVELLQKPLVLSRAELVQIEAHAETGAALLRDMDYLKDELPLIRAHHENWDGSGYPLGLRGEQIPLGAQVLRVADAFDAMTSRRPYRTERTVDEALAETEQMSGRWFGPVVVSALVSIASKGWPAHAESPMHAVAADLDKE